MMSRLAPTALLLLTIATVACGGGPGPDRTPPDAPRGLIVVAGDGQVSLSWTPSLARDLVSYSIWRRPEGQSVHELCDATTRTDAIVAGLENGTTYWFSISAVDEAGNEGERSREVSATPYNAALLTERGWSAWEEGDYAGAADHFQDALNVDPDYGPAYSGLGWNLLKQNDLATAASYFDTAIQHQAASTDARAGGIIVYRELPGRLTKARVYGTQLLDLDPHYVFRHDPAIDADLIRLLLAQIYFLSGEDWFAHAQDLMNQLVPGNGLDSADPASWVVGSVTYSTYPAALLALIEYAGSL